MNLRAFGLVSGALLTGLTSGAALFAQEARPEPQRAEAARSAEQWIQDLGSDSYKQRVAAERALRKLGKAALPALRAAAGSTADPEAQWRSKRLIRQIESGGDGVEARQPQEPRGSSPDARDQFEDVFRRMERDFGIDIPRRRFFRDDFFRDLDEQFRDMREQMRSLQGRMQAMSQGMSMQIGPDGVRVEVEEQNEKGETEKKVYEAPNLETFRQKYPDVLKRNGLMLGDGANPFGLRRYTPRDFGDPRVRLDPLHPDLTPLEIEPMPATPADGERLGVLVKPEIPAGVREYLELGDGVGLMVESVQEGTLAASLGLKAGDIVTAIGGRTIGSPADVRKALGTIEAGKTVEVKFVRRGVEKSAAAAKPKAKKPSEPPAGGRIEPRRGDGKIR